MASYIDLDEAVALIEERQKEICPLGRCGRNFVYGSDREKYDSWDEIIDELCSIEPADVAPVVHGRWERYDIIERYRCSVFKKHSAKDVTGWEPFMSNYCPNCGARMDGEHG